jgi:hypothetical protein
VDSPWGLATPVSCTAIAGAYIVAAFFYFVPPITQDEVYRQFADQRTLCTIPNF